MKAMRPLFCSAALFLIGASGLAGQVAAQGPTAPAVGTEEDRAPASSPHESFNLTAPTEFKGVWNKTFSPFLNPVNMQSWANVRVEAMDASNGSISGHFDVYIRSICYDVVDQPFKGTFDGKTLRLSYEFTQCPGMQPLHLALWKEADGFHGRTLGLPITINKVITPAANP
jgi:hypothetical protein